MRPVPISLTARCRRGKYNKFHGFFEVEMDDSELEIPMPDSYKKFLLNVVQKAESLNRVSFLGHAFFPLGGVGIVEASFIIDGREAERIPLNGGVCEDPFHAFCIFDLLVSEKSPRSSTTTYYLTPKVRRWYKYHKKGPIAKWLSKRSIKDIGLVFSIVVAVVSLVVSILTAMDLATNLKLFP